MCGTLLMERKNNKKKEKEKLKRKEQLKT